MYILDIYNDGCAACVISFVKNIAKGGGRKLDYHPSYLTKGRT